MPLVYICATANFNLCRLSFCSEYLIQLLILSEVIHCDYAKTNYFGEFSIQTTLLITGGSAFPLLQLLSYEDKTKTAEKNYMITILLNNNEMKTTNHTNWASLLHKRGGITQSDVHTEKGSPVSLWSTWQGSVPG